MYDRSVNSNRKTELVGLALFMAFVLMGCREQPGSGFDEEPPAELQLASVLEYGTVEGAQTDATLSDSAAMQELKEQQEAFIAFRVAAKTTDWKQADENVRALLDSPSPVARHYREQNAADVMLREWLVGGEPTEERLKAMAFYVDLLVKNESPQSALILPALKQLDGHWPETRVAEAASVAAHAAEDLVARKTSCENCAAKQLQDALPRQIQSEHDLHLHQTLEAAEELRAISRSE